MEPFTFPNDFFREDIKSPEQFPVVQQIIKLLEKGELLKAETIYRNSKFSGSLYMTLDELKKTKSKRVKQRNERVYGKDFYNNVTFYRKKLYNKQKGICPECQEWYTFTSMSLDHIVARVEGGSNDISNLQMVCKKCHLEKDKHLHTAPDRIVEN